MSSDTQQLMAEAAQFAARRGDTGLDALHILHVAAVKDPVRDMVKRVGGDPEAISKDAEAHLPRGREPSRSLRRSRPPDVGRARRTPDRARTRIDLHRSEHIFLSLVSNGDSTTGRILASAGVTPESMQSAVNASAAEPQQESATPTLDKYGTDLTERARSGGVDPVIGRSDEIEQAIEILARRTKNNPVLVGEAGVGKTAVVEGLAQRIVDGDVPEVLADKKIVQLDLAGMLSGTRYRGDFEERLTKAVDEIVAQDGRLIVFIDELHTIVGAGAGGEGAMDAGNILKPKLARGDLRIVGATTLDEYRKHIEKDPALERRFQPVTVNEPSQDDAKAILSGLRERYEEHHRVSYTDEAISAAVELSSRYIADRYLRTRRSTCSTRPARGSACSSAHPIRMPRRCSSGSRDWRRPGRCGERRGLRARVAAARRDRGSREATLRDSRR